jgi:hypothetical protein
MEKRFHVDPVFLYRFGDPRFRSAGDPTSIWCLLESCLNENPNGKLVIRPDFP